MKTKYTFLMAVALIASQLIGCKTTQSYSFTGASKPIDLSNMGNKNTCDISKSTKAERKYLAYYDYCEGLKNSYTRHNETEIENNAVGAGAAYILITGKK